MLEGNQTLLWSNITWIRNNITSIWGEINRIWRDINNLWATVTDNALRINELNQTIQHLQIQIQQLNQSIQELEQKLEQKTSRITNTLLFYWSAYSMMDAHPSSTSWFHGDAIGLVVITNELGNHRAPDKSFEAVAGAGVPALEIPEYDHKPDDTNPNNIIRFSFLVYLPRLTGGYVQLDDTTQSYIAVAIESFILGLTSSDPAIKPYLRMSITVMKPDGTIIYDSGWAEPQFDTSGEGAFTGVIHLDPNNTRIEATLETDTTYTDTVSLPVFNLDLDEGWYIIIVSFDLYDYYSDPYISYQVYYDIAPKVIIAYIMHP